MERLSKLEYRQLDIENRVSALGNTLKNRVPTIGKTLRNEVPTIIKTPVNRIPLLGKTLENRVPKFEKTLKNKLPENMIKIFRNKNAENIRLAETNDHNMCLGTSTKRKKKNWIPENASTNIFIMGQKDEDIVGNSYHVILKECITTQ